MNNELRIEDLKAGEELVCVDRDGFIGDKDSTNADINAKILKLPKLVVSGFEGRDIFITNEQFFTESINVTELKYFKKKEQHTFNDLIDVARKAFDDGVIFELKQCHQGLMTEMQVSFRISEKDNENIVHESDQQGVIAENWIHLIKSLYKETFVIEAEEDIKRINDGAKITLSNGNTDVVDGIIDDGARIQLSAQLQWGAVGIFILKGATVEQERGRDE